MLRQQTEIFFPEEKEASSVAPKFQIRVLVLLWLRFLIELELKELFWKKADLKFLHVVSEMSETTISSLEPRMSSFLPGCVVCRFWVHLGPASLSRFRHRCCCGCCCRRCRCRCCCNCHCCYCHLRSCCRRCHYCPRCCCCCRRLCRRRRRRRCCREVDCDVLSGRINPAIGKKFLLSRDTLVSNERQNEKCLLQAKKKKNRRFDMFWHLTAILWRAVKQSDVPSL